MSIASLARQSTIPAAIATATTTAAVSTLTKLNEGNGVSGINSISHMIWGDKASAEDQFSAKYTLLGGALNSAAIGGWAAVHEILVNELKVPRRLMPMLVTASLVSGLAYVTDYHVVPKRFTPGFESKLNSRGMLIVYGALALGLAIGTVLARKR